MHGDSVAAPRDSILRITYDLAAQAGAFAPRTIELGDKANTRDLGAMELRIVAADRAWFLSDAGIALAPFVEWNAGLVVYVLKSGPRACSVYVDRSGAGAGGGVWDIWPRSDDAGAVIEIRWAGTAMHGSGDIAA